MLDIVIVGGGITGLAAAWQLEQTGEGVSYALLEASPRWGGKMSSQTLQAEGKTFLADGGPDTLVTRKPETWQLVNELGLQERVIVPASETKNIYVLDNGKIQPIPLSPGLFLRTPLLTWRGRLRLLAEPLQPARRDEGDESLAEFVTRRLGSEALEKFIGPVLGGIYNTDPARQSTLVSSPVMREMEKEAGSLFAAALGRMSKRRAPGPRFINFEGGMEELPQKIASRLTGTLRLNAPVSRIFPTRTGFAVELASGERLEAASVILATLANVSANLLQETAPQSATLLGQIAHQNIGTASLLYRESDLPAKPVINGLMIPRREKQPIDAVTVTSRKLPSRSYPGYTLLRVFFGGAQPTLVEEEDAALLHTLQGALNRLLGLRAQPLASALFRWKQGFPQAEVGHLERVDAIEASLPPGVYLAGSSYRGIAVPDCIRQGRDAAQKALRSSKSRSHSAR